MKQVVIIFILALFFYSVCGDDPCNLKSDLEGFTPKTFPLVSSANPFNTEGLLNPPPPIGNVLLLYPELCACHHIKPQDRPDVGQSEVNLTTIKKRIADPHRCYPRTVPLASNFITTVNEASIRHVPIIKRYPKVVYENVTYHVPIIKTRVVPVVERFKKYVPAIRTYTRSVEDKLHAKVPVLKSWSRPVVAHTIRYVPVTHYGCRPIVDSELMYVPANQPIFRNNGERYGHTRFRPFNTVFHTSSPYSGINQFHGFPSYRSPLYEPFALPRYGNPSYEYPSYKYTSYTTPCTYTRRINEAL